MIKKLTYDKIKRKIKTIFLPKIDQTFWQFGLYVSYWHSLLIRRPKNANGKHYIAIQPNKGAGIGHQLANWNGAYYFAGYFGTEFAHYPFSDPRWEYFLGLGEKEIQAVDLMKQRGICVVQLPKFDENNSEDVAKIKKIIQSYAAKNVLFWLEQDQYYEKQFETYSILSAKFFSAKARKEDALIFTANTFSIALHIRRGDIVQMKQEGKSNANERWLDNTYYVHVLKQTLNTIREKITGNIQVYLFSQGTKADFTEFEEFDNMIYCLDMNAVNSFMHMCYADILISSKSSFSYKPALISKGIKICPEDFWHQYPKDNTFIMVNNKGEFDKEKLRTVI